MKNRSIQFLIFSTLVLLSGCGIFSLHPLYDEEDLIMKTELIGTWQSDGKDQITVLIDSTGHDKYSFVMIDDKDTLGFEMGLLELNNQYFIDLFPMEDCNFPGGGDCDMVELMVRNYIPAHSFMKLDYENGAIILTEFDNERLIDLFAQNRIRLPHEMIDDDDYVVITASTKDLQKFITRYANDKEAFNDPEKYHRL